MGSITTTPKVLESALKMVKPAVSTRSEIVAQSGVHLQTTVAGPQMLAGDGETNVIRAFAGQMDGTLSVVVEHADLVRVAKAFAGYDQVTLANWMGGDKSKREMLACWSGTRRVELPLLRAEDFAEIPVAGGMVVIESLGGQLRDRLIQSGSHASSDETRPILTGILLSNGLLVSTDSYHLAMLKVPGCTCEHEVIMGPGVVKAAKQMPKDMTVRVISNDRFTFFVWRGTVWSVRNIEGQYPNYRQLMPESYEGGMTAETSKLVDATKLAQAFLRGYAPVRLWMNGSVKIHGSSPDGPSFEETIEGATVSLPPADPDRGRPFDQSEFEIGLNPEFFGRVLAHVTSEHTRIRVISPLRPVLVENTDHDDDKFLVMPVRLNV